MIYSWDILANGILRLEDLPNDGSYIATHIQIDEINNTKKTERRDRLLSIFEKMQPKIVPTESLVWDVSHWDKGKFSDGILYEKLKKNLDARNKSKDNNRNDALIAEVAISKGYTLLTADNDLFHVTENNGGNVRRYPER